MPRMPRTGLALGLVRGEVVGLTAGLRGDLGLPLDICLGGLADLYLKNLFITGDAEPEMSGLLPRLFNTTLGMEGSSSSLSVMSLRLSNGDASTQKEDLYLSIPLLYSSPHFHSPLPSYFSSPPSPPFSPSSQINKACRWW